MQNFRLSLSFAVIGAVFTVGMAAPSVSATPSEILDQSAATLASDQGRASFATDWPMQLFTPSRSGYLSRLDLALSRESSRVDSFHVDVFPVDSNSQVRSDPVYGNLGDEDPVEIPAQQISADSPSSPNYRWTTIQVSRPLVLVAGQKYAVRLVPSDGPGNITWHTSSSIYPRGYGLNEGGGTVYADDNETVPLEYGFKTWMTSGAFANDGVWISSSTPAEMGCETVSGYCRIFKSLSTTVDGSKVFGVSNTSELFLHSSDTGANYTISSASRPISDGGVAGSASFLDGQGVLVARFCNLWKSTDGGNVFSRVTGVEFGRNDNACFKQVAATEDGQVMAAVASGAVVYGKHQGVYVSTNSGATWTETQLDHSWKSISMNSDGSKMAMVSDDGMIKLSTDSGSSWSDLSVDALNSGVWNSVSMTATGEIIYLSDSHRLFKVNLSTSEQAAFGIENVWTKVQTSSDGNVVVALDDSGNIFSSRDGGQTIAMIGNQDIIFADFVLAPSGTVVFASTAGGMYRIDPNTVDSTITLDPDPVPEPVPTPMPNVGGTKSMTKHASVQFAASSTVLSKQLKASISASVKKAGKDARYTVTGSAGKVSGMPIVFVKALAKKRATVVKAYLVRLGVKRSHILIKIKIVNSGVTPKTKILAKFASM